MLAGKDGGSTCLRALGLIASASCNVSVLQGVFMCLCVFVCVSGAAYLTAYNQRCSAGITPHVVMQVLHHPWL